MANETINRDNYAELSGGLSLKAKSFNFDRDAFQSIAEMKSYSTRMLPPMYLSYNLEDRKIYKYDTDNLVDEATGKWREFGAASKLAYVLMKQEDYDLINEEDLDPDTLYLIKKGD